MKNSLPASIPLWSSVYLIFSLLFRLVLVFTFLEPSALSVLLVIKVISIGLLVDTAILLPPLTLMTAMLALTPDQWTRLGLVKHGFTAFFTFSVFGLTYLFITEYFFFEEFNARFNYIAVEYLLYPHEVFVNIKEYYPVTTAVLSAVGLALGVSFFCVRWIRMRNQTAWSWKSRLGMVGAGALLSTLMLMTVSIKTATWNQNRIVNEITANGIFGFFYSMRTADLDYRAYYETMPREEMQAQLGLALSKTGHPALEPLPVKEAVEGTRPLNVVFIIEESLGSDFIGALGDERGLTPAFDQLCQSGTLFTHMFATGNRTIRGLEATLTSFPPLPGRSVVKRDHTDGFYSLQGLLKSRGYTTRFLYGGRGFFDNMENFMSHSGFESFVDQAQIKYNAFETAWGLCDQDTFNEAVDQLDDLASGDKPFFLSILTVSNHKPYTYPEGVIARDPLEKKRENAVSYADFALGQFFEKVSTKAYYEDTLFVIYGDHGARVYGSEKIPLASYRVPCLMINSKRLARDGRYDTLASQMDIPPTVLGILGFKEPTRFFGRNMVTATPNYPFVLLQHNRNLALFDGVHVVSLGLSQINQAYDVDRDYHLVEKGWDLGSEDRKASAVAFFQKAYELYSSSSYKLAPGKSE